MRFHSKQFSFDSRPKERIILFVSKSRKEVPESNGKSLFSRLNLAPLEICLQNCNPRNLLNQFKSIFKAIKNLKTNKNSINVANPVEEAYENGNKDELAI